jgi:hypothetical protein
LPTLTQQLLASLIDHLARRLPINGEGRECQVSTTLKPDSVGACNRDLDETIDMVITVVVQAPR